MQPKYDSIASAASAVIEIGQALKVCADDQAELNHAAIDSAARQAHEMIGVIRRESSVMARWAFRNQARAWGQHVVAGRRLKKGLASDGPRYTRDLAWVATLQFIAQKADSQEPLLFSCRDLIGHRVAVSVKTTEFKVSK